MHLLRRRLSALSTALETMIRAMQDLRIALERIPSYISGGIEDTGSGAVGIDTRKPMKTASKLYDIIDQLEKMRV